MPDGRTVKVYDFKRPDKFSREQIRTLGIMHESFARNAGTVLSTLVRTSVDWELEVVDQLAYYEFVDSIPDPSSLAILRMNPLRGSALLQFDPAVAFAMFDRAFGGSGQADTENRPLSVIERPIFEWITARTLGTLREAWSMIIDLHPTVGKVESSVRLATILPPSEMCVLISMRISVGDISGHANLVLPYLTLEPIIPRLGVAYMYSKVRQGPVVNPIRVDDLDVATELCLTPRPLAMRDLASLKKGTMIEIPLSQGLTASLRSGGIDVLELRAQSRRSPYGPFTIMPAHAAPMKSEEDPTEERDQRLRESILADLRSMIDGAAPKPAGEPETLEDVPTSAQVPFGYVDAADADLLADHLARELPQAAALVLSHLEPGIAAQVLGALPEVRRPSIVRRIATMERTNPAVPGIVSRTVERVLLGSGGRESQGAGGVDTVVGILNLVNRNVEKLVIESLEQSDPELSERLKERMFVFEDIALLTDESLETVVNTVDRNDLLVSLKTVPPEIRERVSNLISRPMREGFENDYAALGRMPLSDVESAQLRVIQHIRELEEEGRIFVARPEDLV